MKLGNLGIKAISLFHACANKFELREIWHFCQYNIQIEKFTWPTWDPPGSYRPQVGPMLATWTLLSGHILGY